MSTSPPQFTADTWRRLLAAADQIDFPVVSTSMKPTIRPGDLVQVRPATLAELHPGDLVVYERDGQLICHRLLPGGRLRGDNCAEPDPPVDPERVIGVVHQILRDGQPVPDDKWRRLHNRVRFLIDHHVFDRFRK